MPSPTVSTAAPKTGLNAWRATTKNMAEVWQPESTHLGIRTQDGETHMSLNRPGLSYMSLPSWHILLLQATAKIPLSLAKLRESGISGRVPMRSTLSTRKQLPEEMRPISR